MLTPDQRNYFIERGEKDFGDTQPAREPESPGGIQGGGGFSIICIRLHPQKTTNGYTTRCKVKFYGRIDILKPVPIVFKYR